METKAKQVVQHRRRVVEALERAEAAKEEWCGLTTDWQEDDLAILRGEGMGDIS